MIFFVCPDASHPVGGIKQAYRQVQILADAGIEATILHREVGFRCTWFKNQVPLSYIGNSAADRLRHVRWQVVNRFLKRWPEQGLSLERGRKIWVADGDTPRARRLADGDLIVLPEFWGRSNNSAVTTLPVAIFNQNTYSTFRGFPLGTDAVPTVYTQDNLVGVAVVSEYSEECLDFAFPGIRPHRVVNGVDAHLFHPNDARKPRTLAFMPRKLGDHVQQAINLLRFRGALRDWTLVPIEGLDEEAVAERLRTSTIFMSTCSREGFGLPPLEAAMSGCAVVGYTGRAADEFMDPAYCEPVPQEDVLALAQALERTMQQCEQQPEVVANRTREFSSVLSERYSLERERQSVLETWTAINDRGRQWRPERGAVAAWQRPTGR